MRHVIPPTSANGHDREERGGEEGGEHLQTTSHDRTGWMSCRRHPAGRADGAGTLHARGGAWSAAGAAARHGRTRGRTSRSHARGARHGMHAKEEEVTWGCERTWGSRRRSAGGSPQADRRRTRRDVLESRQPGSRVWKGVFGPLTCAVMALCVHADALHVRNLEIADAISRARWRHAQPAMLHCARACARARRTPG